jgi:hypothetical protein
MCGTGVLQALGAAGPQTLLLRLLMLLLLYCWQVVVAIDDQRPDMPLALTHGRLLLLAAPLLLFSTWRFGQAIGAVNAQGPVSCCAVLYAQVASPGGRAMGAMISPRTWAALCFGGALPVIVWGCFLWRRPGRIGPLAAGLAAGVLLLWIGAAVMALKTTMAAYLLEVLSHPCPWCLFLREQRGAGFALFGLLAFAAAEGVAGFAAAIIGRCRLPAAAPALARVALAGRRLWLTVLLFVILAAAPVLLWRLRFGGWIT